MLFSELLPEYSGKFEKTEISGLTDDSREVKAGFVFVCIEGPIVDGHNFAKQAFEAGASVIVCEKDLGLDNQVVVSDTHDAFAVMCSNYFGNPQKDLHLVGVTGTNGKTSVTYMLKSILEHAGNKVGLVGTIQYMIGDRVVESHNTTPGIYELNALFAQMRDEGCKYAIMEVSSHALHQKRVAGFEFDVAIFTNLTQDHLDYHKTMENYLEAKKILFSMCKTGVINADDKYSAQLMQGLTCKTLTYSESNFSDYAAKSITFRPTNVEYELMGENGLHHIKVNTGGKFTVYNSLAAIVSALELGVDIDVIREALSEMKGVKGRAEVVPTGRDFTVIIDYAHTPDGLKNILSTFRECEKNRLTVVFGCGGDRDKTKRPIMGNIAVRNADFVIITSDNPRTEDPDAIIKDIVEGTKGVNTPTKVIANRIEAINYAISTAQKDDIIILAGKGHETYQILNTGTIHLDEREVVAEALKNL